MTPLADVALPGYPWPDEEMMARYGLRRLTPAEQQACPEQGRRVFPGLRLALDVFKARLIRPPAVVLRARQGWVVWIAETYPGSFLARLPGGAVLPAPYHHMAWERVPSETAATTIEDVRAEQKRLQEDAGKWRPGQAITTPGTRLSWDSLAGWNEAWQQLQARAHSSDRYIKVGRHLRALPLEMIAVEEAETTLYDFLSLMQTGDARPPRGLRENHPSTPLVVAAHNRLAQVGAVPYRQYRQQQTLRRSLADTAGEGSRKRPSGEKAAPHLSLF